MPQNPTVHQLKITLQGAKPPLWRRILVPSDATLGFVHEVIQEAFNWEGFHLHRFEDSRGREWGDPSQNDGYFGGGYSDEEDAVLGKVARAEGTVLTYVYDFGDDWYHRIEVEKVLPADPAVSYPICTGGRRAAPPAEDIGGAWGLNEIVFLVAHPEEEAPEQWEDLVGHLRETGWDPAAFDQAELNEALAGFSAPESAPPSRKRVAVLTEDDLAYCTCGQCQAGDPVRSPDGGYLLEDKDDDDIEVFRLAEAPPAAELAADIRTVPLIDAALRLAQWCSAGRQVTGKNVLRPALAREAVEELRLWTRDPELADPQIRADVLGAARSAGDIRALDEPWQFAVENGLIDIRSGRAQAGPELSPSEMVDRWTDAVTGELTQLSDHGSRILPGMLSMIGEQLGTLIPEIARFLYRLPDEEWGRAEDLPYSKPPTILDVFTFESAARLYRLLGDLGGAEVSWGRVSWRADTAAISPLFGVGAITVPDFRARLTPLGRHALRAFLTSEGHIARTTADLPGMDAAEFLDVLTYCPPESLQDHVTAWLAGRNEAKAITEILDAAAGDAPDRALLRGNAIVSLTLIAPTAHRDLLRAAAADGTDGSRQVAAAALVNLGEQPPGLAGVMQHWVTIDTLAGMRSVDALADLAPPLLDAMRSAVDDMWRCGHPAAADTLEALADVVRDSDKNLAKRLRKSAHKARSQAASRA
jgi:Plasmid pRiA4b ORF-3-like protein